MSDEKCCLHTRAHGVDLVKILEAEGGPVVDAEFFVDLVAKRSPVKWDVFSKKVLDQIIPQSRKTIDPGKAICGQCARKADGEWRCVVRWYCPRPINTLGIPAPCPHFEAKPKSYKAPKDTPPHRKIPQGVRFIYLGRPGPGIITAAYRVHADEGVITMGFTFWNQKGWVKAEARDAALESMEQRRIFVPYIYFPKQTAMQVTMAVAAHDLQRLEPFSLHANRLSGHIPSWTKRLVKGLVPKPKKRKIDVLTECVPECAAPDLGVGQLPPEIMAHYQQN